MLNARSHLICNVGAFRTRQHQTRLFITFGKLGKARCQDGRLDDVAQGGLDDDVGQLGAGKLQQRREGQLEIVDVVGPHYDFSSRPCRRFHAVSKGIHHLSADALPYTDLEGRMGLQADGVLTERLHPVKVG